MNPVILDGKALSARIEDSLKERVVKLVADNDGRKPVLATILVGDDPASATYVKMKGNACARVGMESRRIHLGGATTTEELLAKIDELNSDSLVQGILLQHPVPKQIDERLCFDRIVLEKDVDGVTCLGFGRLSMGERAFGSATPAGIMDLLREYRIPIEGKHAVVVGRSPILGKPMSMMLLQANATVTICHSKTRDLPAILRTGEIVVGAVGIPAFIKSDWLRDGAVLIDAGYHPAPAGGPASTGGKEGSKRGVGDIDLDAAKDRSSAYTPVPGGVGPMTIATLIRQTVEAAERANR